MKPAFKTGDLVHWKKTNGEIDRSRIDRVTKIVNGIYGGFDYLTEETEVIKPRIGKATGDNWLVKVN